jgi:DNA modification methylase
MRSNPRQLGFSETDIAINAHKDGRTGTFVDNMKLPVHRWFRFSAGFSAEWAEFTIDALGQDRPITVLDPFSGSGTTLIAADVCRVPSIGVEAHPFVARIAKAKLLWPTQPESVMEAANDILNLARARAGCKHSYPSLIQHCYSDFALQQLDSLRVAWEEYRQNDAPSELIWLAITAILRPTSHVGTAQWQYVLPNKRKSSAVEPYAAFQRFISVMCSDLELAQGRAATSLAIAIEGDAQTCAEVPAASVDVVITSPPYANNYDYADATRLEMSFWGEVKSWGELHNAVRRNLIVSSSQHASTEHLSLDELLSERGIDPIKPELTEVCRRLEKARLSHGGKKNYHTMIAAYFADMARVWQSLRRVCKPDARVCFVIGDSAPYGIHVPVELWLAELAVAVGFKAFAFEKIRDRNIKWKNRKHQVPLQEGRLWIRG